MSSVSSVLIKQVNHGGHGIPSITEVTPNPRKHRPTCYTYIASNTTVVVRLLWLEPEFPPNFPPFVFGVNQNWYC